MLSGIEDTMDLPVPAHMMFLANALLPDSSYDVPAFVWGAESKQFNHKTGDKIGWAGMGFGRTAFSVKPDNESAMTPPEVRAFMLAHGRVPMALGLLDAPINYAANFDLNLIIDGQYYQFPDLWWIYAPAFSVRQPTDAIMLNWMQYQPFAINMQSMVGKDAVEILAYREGDPNQPVVFFMKAEKFMYQSMTEAVQIRFDFSREIMNGAPSDFVDEFNEKLALKRKATNWTYNVKQLSKTPLLHNYKDDGYLCLEHGKFSMIGEVIEVNPDSVKATQQKEYVSVSTMTNQVSAGALTLKTSDYQHQYKDATTFAHNWSNKESTNISIKGSMFFKETSATFAYEHVDQNTETTVHEDTRTFTVYGQTVAVPTGKTIKVVQEWLRGSFDGTATTYLRITGDNFPKVTLTKKNGAGGPNELLASGELDLNVAHKDLGMKTLAIPTNDSPAYILSKFTWHADIGVAGNLLVSETTSPFNPDPSPQPKPNPTPDPTPTGDSVTVSNFTASTFAGDGSFTLSTTGVVHIQQFFDESNGCVVSMSGTSNKMTCTFSDLSFGSHTISVQWVDSQGTKQTTIIGTFTRRRPL